MYYPHEEFQIWRVNNPGSPSTLPSQSTNIVKQVAKGTAINPCSELKSAWSSQSVPFGSTLTDVGVESTFGGPGMVFSLVDSSGFKFFKGCFFKGSPYAPAADPDTGFNAGVLTCEDNVRIQCIRPYDNQATTCGGHVLRPISSKQVL
jgi:hypothetical protein